MTLTACARTWGPDAYNWASSAATDVGMRLHEAFSAFAATVNATPANADLQLSVLRNHASATGTTSYGFAWRLGHPVSPLVLSFHNVSLVQGFSSSTASALLRLGLASNWIDDSSNGGYGSFSATLLSTNRGLSHYGPTGTPAVAGLEGTLIVVFDTTPGAEFFLATLLRPGDDNYSLNLSILLFRSPAVSGWSLWFHRASGYVGMIGSNDRWSWRGDTPLAVSSISGGFNNQQITAPITWQVIPLATGPVQFNSVQPRLTLPPLLWAGENLQSDPRRLGRFTDPGGGGTFYQLGSAGGFVEDLWLRLPSPGPPVLSGWSAIGSLSWRTLSDRFSVVAQPPLSPSLVGPGSVPDLIADWSPNAAGLAGVQQHPLYAQQLAAAGGLGNGSGGGGGSGRPLTGVLWPRRV